MYIDYERYLARLLFYSQRQFACEITGRTGLTFYVALQSETDLGKDIDDSFIESLKEPVLRKVQCSQVSRLDSLVDRIYETFQADFYPGEIVVVYDGSVYREAVVREKTKLDEMTFPDGFHRLASTRYGVDMRDKKLNNFHGRKMVDTEALARGRGTFTKSIIKSFLRNAVRRENINSPWMVKEPYAQKYKIHISTTVDSKSPGTLSLENNGMGLPLAAEVPGATKVPQEDLNLPASDAVRPTLSTHWTVRKSSVPCLLETWAFYNVFLEVLTLDSFTLDDFSDALAVNEPCELVDELYCCILKILAEEQESKLDNELVKMLGLADDNDSEDGGKRPETDQWRQDLGQQNFSNGRFYTILVGLLEALSGHASHGPRSRALLDEIMQDGSDDLASTFTRLPPDSKLHLLATLVDLTWQTALVRQYIDECMDHLTQLRKDKATLSKDKRTLLDEIYQLRLKMRAQFPRLPQNGAGKSANRVITDAALDTTSSRIESSESDTEHEVERPDDAGEESHSLRRASRRSRTMRTSGVDLKEPLRAAKSPSVESKHATDSRANCEFEISRIKRLVARVDDKLAKVEEEFRESDSQRLRKLGQDRFYSNYWFLESTGMPVHGMPNCSTSHAGYATGRIFVQGTTQADLEELQIRSKLHDYDYLRRRTAEEGSTSLSPGMWGYYDDADQVNALLDWLNPKGIRESKLKTAIEQRGEIIAQSMENREKYLTDQSLPERRSSRKHETKAMSRSPLNWKNLMARKTLGTIHSAAGVVSHRKRKR